MFGPLLASVALLTLWSATTVVAQTPSGFDAAWHELAAHFQERANEEGIVGGSLWLVHEGNVLAKAFHGFADLDSERRVDAQTIYHWASITKTFTGIAIMQLRDRGLLRLDDPVVHYLPVLQQVHNPYGPMEDITIRHLMSHSAGFRGPTWPWGGDAPWHPHEPKRWEQLVAMMPYTEIHFEPGSRYSYSNLGVIFLGQIIERLTGDDYEVYIDKNLFKPLGMHRSYFDTTPYHLLPYRSNNYTVADGERTANGFDFDTGITVSNGGLNAPVPDMVKYVSFLTGAGEQVLDRSLLEEMWRPVVPMRPGTYGALADAASGERAGEAAMGLTFFVYQRNDVKIVGHTGSQKAFRAFVYLEPATGVAALAAFNTAGDPRPDTDALMDELRTQLFEQIFPLFR